MRLIGTFETEKEAYSFYSFLLKEGVQNIYESYVDKKTGARQYRVWIQDEDDLEVAVAWLKEYREKSQDPKFHNVEIPLAVTSPPTQPLAEKPPQTIFKERRFLSLMTSMVIALCAFLFLWNTLQQESLYKKAGPIGAEIGMTPIAQALYFDEPASYKYIEEAFQAFPFKDYKEEKEIPPQAMVLLKKAHESFSWNGIYDLITAKSSGPMFEKIREGEVWRLFTPCLLHRDFLHLLFNMGWVLLLMKQIEMRLSKFKLCLLILIIGIVSNTFQYLMSGPYFLGFSGVVVGLAGFIWMRQRKAPWEGYPLKKGMVLFMVLFILAMFILELFTFGLKLFSSIDMTPGIANTAHIVGGLTGIVLGRIPVFARRMA